MVKEEELPTVTESLAVYEKVYANMESSLEVAKGLVQGTARLTRDETEPLIVVKLARERLLQLFSTAEVVEVCRRCGGVCCSRKMSYMNWNELFYLVGISPKFWFPEPDWKFLAKSLDCCVFLSEDGCILRENRPNRCLLHICKKLRPVVPVRRIGDSTEMFLLESILRQHLSLWCTRVIGDNRTLSSLLYLNMAQYGPVKGKSGTYESFHPFRY